MSDPTQDTSTVWNIFRIRGYHPLWQFFPELSSIQTIKISKSYNPGRSRFGLFPVRSSLLRESLLISCLRLLRYFSSPTSLPVLNDFGHRISHKWDGFLHSEISGSSRDCSLPEAYRKLQRPSSDMSVKESVIHLYVTFFVSRHKMTGLRLVHLSMRKLQKAHLRFGFKRRNREYGNRTLKRLKPILFLKPIRKKSI